MDLINFGSQWLNFYNVIYLWLLVYRGYIYFEEYKVEK